MKILGIIPARYASSRFPGKPLAVINGKSMIQRVYEQSSKAACLSRVLVATDDNRILNHVTAFGGKAVMTSSSHQSGTDRCAEAVKTMESYDVVINIQGDEPYIQPGQIELLASCFNDKETNIATLAKKITDRSDLFNPNVPKIIVDSNLWAIYFSRHPIPYLRNAKSQEEWVTLHTYYKHIGIYGYRLKTLRDITSLSASPLEKAESLEQLRWIENGYRIKTAFTDMESIAIDTPEDLQKTGKGS